MSSWWFPLCVSGYASKTSVTFSPPVRAITPMNTLSKLTQSRWHFKFLTGTGSEAPINAAVTGICYPLRLQQCNDCWGSSSESSSVDGVEHLPLDCNNNDEIGGARSNGKPETARGVGRSPLFTRLSPPGPTRPAMASSTSLRKQRGHIVALQLRVVARLSEPERAPPFQCPSEAQNAVLTLCLYPA